MVAKGPQLVWVVEPPHDDIEQGPLLSLSALDPDDPVGEMYGIVTPAGVDTVGFLGDSRARQLIHQVVGPVRRDGRVVHLVHRDGTEVRSLPGGPGVAAVVTPLTSEPSAAPVADACRRMLGLPAAPPPPHSIDWWVDRWIEMVLVLALGGATPSWQVVSELAATGARLSPAGVARVLVEAGRLVPWSELHRDQIALARGRTGEPRPCACPPEIWPFDDPDVLSWMDAGTFARARIGGQPSLCALLDSLDELLAPDVADQVRAAVSMALAEARSGSPT